MTPETEKAPPAAVISGGYGDAKITRGRETMGKSSSSNGCQLRGRGWCGGGGKVYHQERVGQVGHFNFP